MKSLFLTFAAIATFAGQTARADLPPSTQVRGKVLMADCSRTLIEASARDLKDECVVVYSGLWTAEGKEGLEAHDAEGNIGFAKESTGVLNYIGKHVQMDVNLNNGKIRSVENPD